MQINELEYVPCSVLAQTKAEEIGGYIVYPLAHQVFIDIDTEEAYQKHCEMFNIFKTHIVCDITERPSKSGLPHRHIVVSLSENIDTWQRLALQAALGSDLKREILGCIMAFNNDPFPSLFIEKEVVNATT